MNQRVSVPIAITGHAWEIPAFGARESLDEALRDGPSAQPQFAPELTLGKKGLRYKERATLLALCAAKNALRNAGFIDDDHPMLDAPDFGVIVASNTNNLDTVCGAAHTIRQEHVNATSSMDLPNASSNVVAASIAIRFGLKALNLMICSGSSASLDALVLAANTIRNGRARRMLVVSVEADGLAVRSLLAGQRLAESEGAVPLLEGAAAVVLESEESAQSRSATVRGRLGEHAFVHADAPDERLLRLFDRHLNKSRYLPHGCFVTALHDRAFGDVADRVVDLGPAMHDAYGSAALLQLIHACEQTASGKTPPRGALVFGGGTWMDRRAGAVVLEAEKASP